MYPKTTDAVRVLIGKVERSHKDRVTRDSTDGRLSHFVSLSQQPIPLFFKAHDYLKKESPSNKWNLTAEGPIIVK